MNRNAKSKRTCTRCLLYRECEISAPHKPACGDYIADPFRLERREARWTFKARKATQGEGG